MTWLLEVNGLLHHEHIGFRLHLAAQGSLLDFLSDVGQDCATGNYTAAAFLDLQSAFDRVGAQVPIDFLHALGLALRLFRFPGG